MACSDGVLLERPPLQRMEVRRLGPGDLTAVERHLLALDPADRRARFGSTLADASLSAYVRGIDVARAVLFGAVDGATGRLLGLAEAQRTTTPRVVEIAVSVHAAHRRRGVGGRLVREVLQDAFAEGAESAEVFFDPDNHAAIRLIQSLGGQIELGSTGRAEIRKTSAPCASSSTLRTHGTDHRAKLMESPSWRRVIARPITSWWITQQVPVFLLHARHQG